MMENGDQDGEKKKKKISAICGKLFGDNYEKHFYTHSIILHLSPPPL